MTDTNKTPIDEKSQMLAAKIRVVREHYGLSRPKFSEELGIPATSLKNYELGYRAVKGHVIVRLANHPKFGKHMQYLLSEQAEITNVNYQAAEAAEAA